MKLFNPHTITMRWRVDLDDPVGERIHFEDLKRLLHALTQHDRAHLLANPRIPLLYHAGVRYEEEPLGEENWDDVHTVMQNGWGDCFPEGSLLLTRDMQIVPIELLPVGASIWGLDKWTRVVANVYKGILEVDAIELNNGSVVKLTGGHHVLVAECHRHALCCREDRPDFDCSCPMSERTLRRVTVSELRPGMVIPQPSKLPFGSESFDDPDRAYIEGLYAADGWSDKNSRFSIAGKDGFPKEEQKREVEQICNRLGIHTRWHERYIAVNDGDWALRLQRMGRHAPEKRLLSINYDEVTASSLLRGVMADAHKNTSAGYTFGSTSRMLTIQVRLLQKMFGRTSSVRLYADHGGLGTHPIWRLNVRAPQEKEGKLLRVRSVDRGVFSLPCWDIETEDHHVYLPEHDVTVQNCEDLACWRAAELQNAGVPAFATFLHRKINPKMTLFHIVVALPPRAPFDPARGPVRLPGHVTHFPDGSVIEDPSKMLGMGRKPSQYTRLASPHMVKQLAPLVAA